MKYRTPLPGILTVLALALAPAWLSAQAPDSGAFFVRLGKDTLAVERYVRDSHELVAEAVLRTPQTRRMKLSLTFNDQGGVSWYEILNDPVPGVPRPGPRLRSVVTYVGQSAQIEMWAAAVPTAPRRLPAAANMIPLQPPFYSLYETALLRLRRARADTATLTMLAASGPYRYLVHWLRTDTVTLYNQDAGGPLRIRFNAAGQMVSLDGSSTTFKIFVTRARWANLDALAKRFAAIDAAGKPMGPLSPRETADGFVAGSNVTVTYGRPSRRGRAIFGELVPWGQVWRTGANEATQLELSDTVRIGGVRVPAGKYSLWTIPGRRQWLLIINKQTGQWGTNYDPKQDLVRIPVRAVPNVVPVEQFTIALRSQDDSRGLMTLSWERTRVIVPFTHK